MMNYYHSTNLKYNKTLKNISILKTFFLVGFCFATCVLISCKDEESEAGINILPNGEQYFVSHDSLTSLKAFTYYQRDDTIKINPSRAFIGVLHDPRFGKSTCNILTELTPELDTTFGSKYIFPTIDSVCLNLQLSSAFYGSGKTKNQTINVYHLLLDKMLSTIAEDTNVNYNDYFEQGLVKFEVNYDPTTRNDTFPLTQQLSQDYIDLFTLNRTHFSDDSSFRKNVLRGLYFEAVDNGNEDAINYINLSKSSLEVYYQYIDTVYTANTIHHIDTISKSHLLSMISIVNENSEEKSSSNCNIFSHEYTLHDNIDVIDYSQDPDDNSIQNEYLYIKSNYGLESRFQILNVNHWKDSGNVFINKASLELTVDFLDDDRDYNPNPYLYVYFDDMPSIKDIDMEYIGATVAQYNSETEKYSIPMTDILSTVINSDDSQLNITLTTGLYQSSGGGNFGTERVVICGTKHPTNPPRLQITHTKL
ncbi:MAG: DUF4270 family protein [Salinivirgaceae bacterium]|nr:DUF4270 family protein [Salinivirgaceae bacterium]